MKEVDRLPIKVKEGEKYIIRLRGFEKHEKAEIVVEKIVENKTTDKTPGAKIIICRGRVMKK